MTCIFYGILNFTISSIFPVAIIVGYVRNGKDASERESERARERERERERDVEVPSLKYRTAQRLEPAFELDLARINLSVLLSELLDLQKKKEKRNLISLVQLTYHSDF